METGPSKASPMMKQVNLQKIRHWIERHPGIFQFRLENRELSILEIFSRKTIKWNEAQIQKIEERENRLKPGESYLGVLLSSGVQVILSQQGFAFPPDFTNTGPIPLPNPVYCLQDILNLLGSLKHLAAEEDRRREALELITILITLLDGARAVGLEVEQETREVEKILNFLETSNPVPPPHRQL